MTTDGPNPTRPMNNGVPVPTREAFNDPPLMDVDYGDLRVADRIALDTATKYGLLLDLQYMSSAPPSRAGTRKWYYDANGKMQYYSGPSPAGTVTLIWNRDDYLEAWS